MVLAALALGTTLGMVGFILTACASSSKAPQQVGDSVPPGTTTITFHAYTTSGKLAVKVAGSGRGECWTTSIAAPAPTAYRCFKGNQILDPCFVAPNVTQPDQLACIPTPWAGATLLRVAGALPTPSPPTAPSRPWAFQLKSGLRCVASTGTVPELQGVNLGYHCANGGDATLTDSGSRTLTARYAAPNARTLQSVPVTTIWQA